MTAMTNHAFKTLTAESPEGTVIFAGQKYQTRTVTYDCPKHGTRYIVQFCRHDGTWPRVTCDLCFETSRPPIQLLMKSDPYKAAYAKLVSLGVLDVQNPMPSATFDGYKVNVRGQAKAVDACRRFAEGLPERLRTGRNAGLGLYLHGGYGTGKTHLASAILGRCKDLGVPGAYVSAVDFFDVVNGRDSGVPVPAIMGALSAVAVLVIDELGVQSWTDAERKRLQQILDKRWDRQLPTVICTNMNEEELGKCCGGRVASRVSQRSYTVSFPWADYRRAHNVSDMAPEDLF